jgi:hypothetical protein
VELIDPVGKTLDSQIPLIAGRQNGPVLIRLAADLNGRSYAETGRVGHPKMKFTAIALAKER